MGGMRRVVALAGLAVLTVVGPVTAEEVIQLGPRPYYLVGQMKPGALKDKLERCATGPFRRTAFSIAHRGAPLMFPEHTQESYEAAASMGAGIVECDVTFTRDKALVCRHSQCDLHTTTNILAIPELAAKCSVPFSPGDPATGTKARVKCCTSDLTLTEFRQLRGKMESSVPTAATPDAYMGGTESRRTELYAAASGTLMTHAESITLFRTLGVKFVPELKAPAVSMPFDGLTREAYAQKLIDEYKAAGIDPKQVFAQSFRLDDIRYWVAKEPAFGAQAVYLDGRYSRGLDPEDPGSWSPGMKTLVADGVRIVAPPIWVLLRLDGGRIAPSAYARAAKAAGLDIVAWTLERSGPLAGGGGWYYKSIREAVTGDGAMYEVLDVLAREVGIRGIFSDWPATVTYYASCMALK